MWSGEFRAGLSSHRSMPSVHLHATDCQDPMRRAGRAAARGPVPVPGLSRGQLTLSLLASLQLQIWLFYLKPGRGTPVHSECGYSRKATAGLKVRGLGTIWGGLLH